MPFISEWNTSNTSGGSSAANQVRLPLELAGSYNFNVDWGDTNSDLITVWNQPETTHTYAAPGNYTITITGTINGWRFNNTGDRLKILDISEWDVLELGNRSNYFLGCSNLNVSAVDALNLTGINNLTGTFNNCSSLTTLDVSGWNVSNVNNFFQMFNNCSSLTTLDVSSWNVGSVTNFGSTFNNCSSLTTLDVSNWNVSNVTSMVQTFRDCSLLTTLDVSNWNVSSVTNFSGTFRGCSLLTTLDVSNWNVSNVTNLQQTFTSCSSLTTIDFSNWNVSNVTTFLQTFTSCSSLTTLDFSNWNVSSVTNLQQMFFNCTSLTTLDVSGWNTGNVANMNAMFNNCTSLTTLDVSNWNVSNVNNFFQMFGNCTSLEILDVSNWDVSNATNLNFTFQNVEINRNIYDQTLINWSQLTLQSSLTCNFGVSRYTPNSAAEAARANIIANFNWTILDGGTVVAPTNIWTNYGAGDNDANNASNWSLLSVPDITNNVVLSPVFADDINQSGDLSVNRWIFESGYNGTFNTNGYNLTATDYLILKENVVIGDLAGSTWTADYFESNGVNLIGINTWYLNVLTSYLITGIGIIENSDASGGITINAPRSINNGNNINWIFSGSVQWVHSGGINNKNPNRDLGGPPSQFKIALQPMNNLFDDIDPEQREIGLTDYRAFYIVNNNFNLHLMEPTITLSSASNIEFGMQQDDEVQRIQFFGGTPENDGYLILQTEFGPPFKVEYGGSFATMTSNFETALQTMPFCSTCTVVLQPFGNPYMDITFRGEAGKRKTELIKIIANRLHSTQGGDFRISDYSPIADPYNGIGDVQIKVEPNIQDVDSFFPSGVLYVFNPSQQIYEEISYNNITMPDQFDLSAPLTFNLSPYDELWLEPLSEADKPFKVTIKKIIEGSPINQIAPIIPTSENTPSGVTFGSSPIILGNVFSLESFPIWIKRTTLALAEPIREDFFELSIQGTLFS